MIREDAVKICTADRQEWREWLASNFETEHEVFFIFPMKAATEKSISYNDAVEEALCFGWIDSTIKHIDAQHRAQRFSPRKPNAEYSRANIERLIWLEHHGMIHPSIRESVLPIITAPYVFPSDILEAIQSDAIAWEYYADMPECYKRIRVAYIDAARNRPAEFEKRLANFINKTRQNRLIPGFGGIDKYYNDEIIDKAAARILQRYKPAFEELAK